MYSFPINLQTFQDLWNEPYTPEQAKNTLTEIGHSIQPRNFQEQVLSQVGGRIYETFFYGYTKKQWGREPRELPASIAKRIPIRLTYDDRYFDDRFQGMPTEGYTAMVERMLDGIEVKLETAFVPWMLDKSYFPEERVVYSGPLDELFGYRFGRLEYRSLRFEHETLNVPDYQGCATINYTDEQIPYTRIIEWKHFRPEERHDRTVITREFPASEGEPYYPVNDEANTKRHYQYRDLIPDWMIVGGRLGAYRYYNMDQVIGMAMSDVRKELG